MAYLDVVQYLFPVVVDAADEVDLELLARFAVMVIDNPAVFADHLVHVVDCGLPAPETLRMKLT